MGTDVRLEPATMEHVHALAAVMREADVAEVKASSGHTPVEALACGLQWSREAWALLIDGEPAAMVGVVPAMLIDGTGEGAPDISDGGGIVWMLSGRIVSRRPVAFVRASHQVLADLLTRWTWLGNFVDARYAAALRWVRRLGFKVHAAQPYGVEGLSFHPITMRRSHG